MYKIITYFSIYFFLFILYILSTFEKRFTKKNRYYLLYSFIAIFVLIYTFRDTGDDLQQYRLIFDSFSTKSISEIFALTVISEKIEFFWILLINILKKNHLSFRFFLFISFTIPIIIITKVNSEFDKDKPLLLFFLFLYINFEDATNIIRQFLAGVIYIYCLSLLAKNNKKYLIISILNIAFHYVSFIFFGIVFFLKRKKKSSEYIMLLSIIFVFAQLIRLLMSNFKFDVFVFEGGNGFFFKVNYYLFNYQKIRAEIAVGINNYIDKLNILLTLVFQICVLFCGNKYVNKDKFTILLLNSQFLGIFVFIIFYILDLTTIAIRLNTFLCSGQFLIVYYLLKNTSINTKNIVYGFFIVINFLILFLDLLHNMYLGNVESPFYLGL